jgi:hypothetical protein
VSQPAPVSGVNRVVVAACLTKRWRWNFYTQKLLLFRAGRRPTFHCEGKEDMSIGTILLIILVLVLLGGVGGIGGSPFYGTGYYGGGGLGLVIVILLILVLMGRI